MSQAKLRLREVHSRQPEIANLEVAVRINEQVSRLEVAVDDTSRVQILAPSQYLVEKELAMTVVQRLRRSQDGPILTGGAIAELFTGQNLHISLHL